MPRYKMIDHAKRDNRRLPGGKWYKSKHARAAIVRKQQAKRREKSELFRGGWLRVDTATSSRRKSLFRYSDGKPIPKRLQMAHYTRTSRRKNPGQSPWQWGVHAWHKPKDGVSAMHHPAWRKFIRWINEGDQSNQRIDLKVSTNRTMTISGVFKSESRAAGFARHVEALPGTTKLSYENRER
jgi:hypothetical protein